MARSSFFIVGFMLALAGTASAQLNVFGQNKIQYRGFDWRVLRGDHIDLYYYPEADELARVALTYAEESYEYLEHKFGHSPHRRVPLIIYASFADFEQTNVLSFLPPEGILGATEYAKRRVVMPFRGSYSQFRHTLRHEMVHVFQLSMTSEVRRRYPRGVRFSTPLWFSEGTAEFWSAGEDSIDDMFLRTLTIEGVLPTIQQMTYVRSTVAYPYGGALVRWLADEYGEWRLPEIYRSMWKYDSFEQAVEGVYGLTLEELDARFRHEFRQRYFPTVEVRDPITVEANELVSLAIRPVSYQLEGEDHPRFLYMSPNTGYMNLYSRDWFGERRRTEVKGDRTAEFESINPLGSRMDVREGVAVFSSRHHETDAIFFFDLDRSRVVGRYQFQDLVAMRSPAWAPDGQSVVFSGLTMGGLSDLYRLYLPDGRLERLTSDRFEDLDPSFSPDGSSVVFTSDRAPWGADGMTNLFLIDLNTREVRYLTYGNWTDQTPRWAENGRIYFSSDREGIFDIYSVDQDGNGHKEIASMSGAFDPEFVESEDEILFTAFHELSFTIFRSRSTSDSVSTAFSLPDSMDVARWRWPELTDSPYARADPTPYERRFSLDFAAGDALITPGVGTAQGALFLFSDLLSDHLLFLALSSFQGDQLGNVVDNFNGTAMYLNQKNRLNWGVGGFRLKGLFREGNLRDVYDESSFGGFGLLRWPLNRFERVEGQFRLERSDRFDFARLGGQNPRRVGWIASNWFSYVKDNTLWLATGPIDGQRVNLTAGVSNDLSNGRFDAWSLSMDHRRYFRIGTRSTFATRLVGYFASGHVPRRVNVGGPLALRGYPRFRGVNGTRAAMLNTEIRFPLTNFLSFGFPFGEIRFPGVQGAIFGDLGGAWLSNSRDRGLLGSTGLGLRMPLLFPIVLRLDFGYRFEIGETAGYALQNSGRRFVDFFIGVNY